MYSCMLNAVPVFLYSFRSADADAEGCSMLLDVVSMFLNVAECCLMLFNVYSCC